MNQKIIAFLKKNGFSRVEKNTYKNAKCVVTVGEESIIVTNSNDDDYFGTDIFWLIGFLTFFGFMDRQYKK